jgi:hypothetical protein
MEGDGRKAQIESRRDGMGAYGRLFFSLVRLGAISSFSVLSCPSSLVSLRLVSSTYSFFFFPTQ